MKGVYFTDAEEYKVPGCYLALIKAFTVSSELFLSGRITVSQL
jgi:hypothetical protein